MSDYSEFNSQYEQTTDTAYKKQNKIEGVSIRTAKQNLKLKLKFYHNKTLTFGVWV